MQINQAEPDFSLASPSEFLELLGGSVIPKHTLRVDVQAGSRPKLRFRLPGEPTKREFETMAHIARIFDQAGEWRADPTQSFSFVFQASDRPVDLPSASWQRRNGFQNVILTLDFYYTNEDGYRYFFSNEVPDWNHREAKVFWRGSTTGPVRIDRTSILTLPRYKLCVESQKLRTSADVAIHNISKTDSDEEKAVVSEQLRTAGLLGDWVDMRHYANFKMVVQIDGNGNSWELVKKLRLGACLLIVDSDWRLFHSTLIDPWVHYVPIRADLSDFVEKVHWCLDNDRQARQIALSGREWALDRDYPAELRECADSIHDRFGHQQT